MQNESDLQPFEPEGFEFDLDEPERPAIGESLPGEPTISEILSAAKNDPEPEFSVNLAGRQFTLVELRLLDSKQYIESFVPALEKVLQTAVPALGSMARSFFIMRNLSGGTIDALREVAASGDSTAFEDSLSVLGLSGLSESTVENLKGAAVESRDSFMTQLMYLMLGPTVMGAFKNQSFSKILLDMVDELPKLVLASLRSSVRKDPKYKSSAVAGDLTGYDPIDTASLQSLIEDCDVLDLVDVVLTQIDLYNKRGKLQSFFDRRVKKIGTTTETPTV
jgi:hypothetical protein